jgi:SAM-dependent MidA family methyltransferase
MPWTAADAFEPITESAPLVEKLRDRINAHGPITFREFMETALYDAGHGYYATSRAAMSRDGDYVTSPELHPVFGALIARQLEEMWRALNAPATFDLVEAGGGRGTLARDILRAAGRSPAFADAVRYTIVDRSALMRDEQRRTLAPLSDRARIVDEMPVNIQGVILSNELLDAFPVHRVLNQGGTLREIYVAHDGERFHDEPGDPSTPDLAGYFDALGLMPGDGCIAEANLDAPRWMTSAAHALKRGYVLTFDYGYEAPELYARWRRDGTLLCFYGQAASSDPYQRIGRQDMTSSVDFTTLRRAGEAAGLATLAITSQSEFLARLGITDALASVAGAQMEEYFARRTIVLALLDPARLGRILVLLQARNAPSGPFTGFADA